MAEFVDALGRYIYDPAAGTVSTVLRKRDAAGNVTEVLAYVCTVQTFLAWAAEARAVEAEIMRHQGRQNVVEMSDYRDQADTA